MTQDEFIEYLEALVAQVGSQAELARQLGVPQQLLIDLLINHWPLRGQLLAALGFTRLLTLKPLMITYRPPETPRKFTVP